MSAVAPVATDGSTVDRVTAAALPDPLPAYLDHVRGQRRLAARTVALYTDALTHLHRAALAADVALAQVQPHHVRRWAAQAHAAGLGARSVALRLSAWRGFFGWWGKQGGISANPVEGVRAPKAAKPLPKALSVDDAVALASATPERAETRLAVRDHAITELLYSSGLRVAELVALDARASAAAAGWIDTAAAQVHVLGKGSKRRVVPVGQAALAALHAWLAVRGDWASADEPALWVSQRGTRLTEGQVRRAVKALGRRAGLAIPVHPHMLRHSMASHVLQSSGDLRAVQELLGHANIATTQVYTRLDFQHLAKVYDAAHPHARKKPTPR